MTTENDGTIASQDGPERDEPPAGAGDMRAGADVCTKCTACDTDCPVAAVDADFPGPKFQGPEQWRLTRQSDVGVDPSITGCSNCMRCDSACPSGVPLSEMHNRARAEYVRNRSLSRRHIRDRLLANYGRLGRVASRMPRLANVVAGSRMVRGLTEKLLGITAEREPPRFAPETFRAWWNDRGPRHESASRRVVYFHGDYANYNTPAVGKALVRTYEAFGYEVAVPDQRCSGTPMFANGMLGDARRAARFNVETLREWIADGYDVVCSCTSCSMALRKEYPELFEFEGTERVARHTYDALEYLRIHEDVAGALADATVGPEGRSDLAGTYAYHAPCHARNQGIAGQAVELFAAVDGVDAEDVGDTCSGISGTYGWKAEKYDISMAIGEELFTEIAATDADRGLTECPTCAMQMEHGTSDEVVHPLEVLAAALGDDGTQDSTEPVQ